ncbi:ABC transporter ATP-binding protein uup, partial [Haemophilus influenzae]
FLIGFSR